MLDVNYTGVFLSARACARQMFKYKIPGSICLIASMSGIIANRGFIAPVYNSSKAAVIQLTRNLAMEWGRKREDGSGGIRVNCLSPGHIVTPMVLENFEKGEASKEEWENNNMLGRLSAPEEYKAAGIFLLSNASSYMVSCCQGYFETLLVMALIICRRETTLLSMEALPLGKDLHGAWSLLEHIIKRSASR